jgi:rieske iron-sulfur protein
MGKAAAATSAWRRDTIDMERSLPQLINCGLHSEVHVARSGVGRRAVLTGGLALVFVKGQAGYAQDDPASIRPREGDLLVKVGDAAATPLTPDDVPVGATQTMAWPIDPASHTIRSGSRLNRILLLRLDPDKLSADTRSRAADGVVAYTAICTHTGCEVIDWHADEQLLSCPCHYSKFDPKDGARVVDGPAPRTLPALPLQTVDGKLVVAKPFTTRVGFEQA